MGQEHALSLVWPTQISRCPLETSSIFAGLLSFVTTVFSSYISCF